MASEALTAVVNNKIVESVQREMKVARNPLQSLPFRWRWRWRWPAASLLGLLLATTALGKAPDRLPIFHIDVAEQNPRQTGIDSGRQWKARFPELERHHDRYLAERFSQQDFDRLLSERVQPLRSQGIAPDYLEELRGVASQLHIVTDNRLGDGLLSADELLFAQLLPDMGEYGSGSGFGVYARRNRQSIAGYNVDGTTTHALESLAAITVYKSADNTVVSIGTAGNIGIEAGFNQKGLFLAYLQADPNSRQNNAREKQAINFTIRGTLEKKSRVTSAAAVIKKQQFNESHSLLLADPTQTVVLEQIGGSTGELRSAQSPTKTGLAWQLPGRIAVVNCLALTTTTNTCQSLLANYRWQRLRTLARDLDNDPTVTVEDVIGIMLDQKNRQYGIFNEHTTKSMVFVPATREIYLYHREPLGSVDKTSGMHHYTGLIGSDNRGWRLFSSSSLLLIWILLGVLLSTAVWIRLKS